MVGVRSAWIGAVLAAGACAVAAVPAAGAAAAAGGTITTVAGGVGGPGPARSVAVSACGVDVAGRSLYIGDAGNMVRRVSTSTGELTTVAGNNAVVGGGNGDPAATVPLGFDGGACGTAVGAAGNLLIADGSQVQVMPARTGTFYGQPMTAGHIYVIAGQPFSDRSYEPLGDGGPALDANLLDATGVALDQAGNVVVADSGMPPGCGDCEPAGALVRIVAESNGTFYGQKMTAGDIYTVAGTLDLPGIAGHGGAAVRTWLGTAIGAIRLDRAGNLLIPDGGENDDVRFIAPSLLLVAVRTGRFYGQQMTAGHLYELAGTSQQASSGDGGPARKASLASCAGVAVDRAGNLVIADGNRARVIAARSGRFYGQQMTAGHIYGIAGLSTDGYSGDGGPAIRARVSASSAAVDGSGNVVLGDGALGVGSRVRVIAARSGRFYGQPMTAGHIYTVAGNGTFYSGSGQPAGRAEFSQVGAVAEDASGDLAFADVVNSVVWVVMGRSGRFFGRAMTAGDSYPVAGAGGPAGKLRLDLIGGTSVAFDHSGNLLVADPQANLIRVIAVRTGRFYGQAMTAGHLYIVAGTGTAGFSGGRGPARKASLNSPGGVAVDQQGNVLVADTGNGRVRVVAARTGRFYGQPMAAGHIYTIAGHVGFLCPVDGAPAIKACLAPQAVAADPAGNVVIADSGRIRVVAAATGTFYGRQMTAGDIYTIAGNGQSGFSGSGGPALDAEFGSAGAVAVDASGNIAMADPQDNVIWVVAAAAGTFYGQAMTVGDIYVVAGNGTSLGTDGLGDGGPVAQARPFLLGGVAITPSGDLLAADNNRIRSISR